MTRLLLVDNFDSFTFNLLDLFGQLNEVDVTIRRNNEPFLEDLRGGQFEGLIISPGPGSPDDEAYFGNCTAAIRECAQLQRPVLGVCLGFQGIALAFGATLKRAAYPMHGKTTGLRLQDGGGRLLSPLPDDTPVMRYHSIMIDADQVVPEVLRVTGVTTPGSESIARNGHEIMAIEHRELPIFGVQFHPESFGTECGIDVAKRFVAITRGTAVVA